MGEHFVGIFEGGVDPAVGIVNDGKLLAYVEEERFIRNKHANGWYPSRSLRFCLDRAGIGPEDVSALAINWDVPSYTNGAMRDFSSRCAATGQSIRRRSIGRTACCTISAKIRSRHTMPPLGGAHSARWICPQSGQSPTIMFTLCTPFCNRRSTMRSA